MLPSQVTFIVPVYNTEKYLEICLDSIINQTVHELEIICVDDCSTDCSAAILSKYAQKDSRIVVIRFDKNKGPGAARNAGLKVAKGKFIRVVDSDDFIPRESTENLLAAAEQYDSDFVRGGVHYCNSTGEKTRRNALSPKVRIGRAVMGYQMINYFPHHWALLYRTATLRSSNVRYDENMRNGQDTAFMIDLAPHMEKVSLIPEVVYFYRVSFGSTMTRKRDRQFYLNIFSLYSRANRQLTKAELKEIADSYLYSHCCGYLPENILSSIPEYLPYEQGIIVLQELQKLFLEVNAKTLCFTDMYSWQKQRKAPQIMKYLLLLLENDLFPEAYAALKYNRIEQKRQITIEKQISLCKSKTDAIHSSISWKITAPLRFVRKKIKK